MSSGHFEELSTGTELVLHAQVATRDSLAVWQRVGMVRGVESGLVVTWDADARYLESVWRPGGQVVGARGSAGKTIRFGVFVGRRCVIVGESWVSAEELVRLRHQVRAPEGRGHKSLGVGPRGLRSGWPRF